MELGLWILGLCGRSSRRPDVWWCMVAVVVMVMLVVKVVVMLMVKVVVVADIMVTSPQWKVLALALSPAENVCY